MAKLFDENISLENCGRCYELQSYLQKKIVCSNNYLKCPLEEAAKPTLIEKGAKPLSEVIFNGNTRKCCADSDFNNALNALIERVFKGKGKERHGGDKPFIEQPIITEIAALGEITGHIYQIRKKALECQKLSHQQTQNEMLDIAAYALAVWIALNAKDII